MMWSEAQVETLLARVAQDLTFGMIASELGLTRNAVIGKAHRLGLSTQRVNRGGAGTHRTKRKRKRMAHTQVIPCTGELVDDGLDGMAHPCAIPPTDGVTLLELRSHHCRWPLGPPLATADRFCGAVVEPGYPYCRYHGCLAYVGPRWARAAAELAARTAGAAA